MRAFCLGGCAGGILFWAMGGDAAATASYVAGLLVILAMK